MEKKIANYLQSLKEVEQEQDFSLNIKPKYK